MREQTQAHRPSPIRISSLTFAQALVQFAKTKVEFPAVIADNLRFKKNHIVKFTSPTEHGRGDALPVYTQRQKRGREIVTHRKWHNQFTRTHRGYVNVPMINDKHPRMTFFKRVYLFSSASAQCTDAHLRVAQV